MRGNYFESIRMMKMTQKSLILLGASMAVILVMGYTGNAIAPTDSALKDYDPIHSELVMNLVVTCSKPERMGPSFNSKDGIRGHAWFIIGGKAMSAKRSRPPAVIKRIIRIIRHFFIITLLL